MKKLILSAGRKMRKIAQAGRRYSNFFRRSAPESSEEVITSDTKPDGAAPSVQVSTGVAPDIDIPKEQPPPPRKKKKRPEWTLDDFEVIPEPGKSRFHDFEIPLPIMRAIADLKFKFCTPIQDKALADVLAGKDLVGKANTGTGKTAVFLIATLSRLYTNREPVKGKGNVRALVLAPTRELVMQIANEGRDFTKHCKLRVQAVYGGVDYQKQMEQLQGKMCDVVVATPGRLLDFIGKGVVDLSSCKILVLDEADRMLDMGFIPDVRRIVGRLPSKKERQTMLFSATVPDDVQRLAAQWCVQPLSVEAEPEQVAVDTVEQTVYLVTADEKYTVLYNLIRQHPDDRIIVFANMKNETKRLANRLERNNVDCVLLSGDVAQNQRMTRLERFREGKVKVLVATDVAGRGIHIDDITFVVNYTLPYEPEDYVHRIGRTGRAGASGKAVSFACEEGAFYLPAIEEFIDRKLSCIVPDEELLTTPPKERPKNLTKAGNKSSKPRRRKPRSRSENRSGSTSRK